MPVSREIFRPSCESKPASLPSRDIDNWILFALATALLLTNRWFTILDDEANAIVVATAPVWHLISTFVTGRYPHAHPPLPDILLHGWLVLTGSRMWLLRVPAIACYIAGIALMKATAGKLGGRSARTLALWIGVLWPYGFHFGRVAGWFEFSFLSVALLTFTFIAAVDQTRVAPWVWFGLAGLLAIYSNLYAWTLLALLLVEVAIRRKRQPWTRFATVLAALAVSYAPVWLFLVSTTRESLSSTHGSLQTILLSLYHLYAVLVSESVAPWFISLSLPAILAMTVAGVVLLACARGFGRRLLIYFVLLLVGMACANVINTKRVLMLTPWLLLGLAMATAEIEKRRVRATLLICFAVIAAVGWVGIAARKFYVAPHFIEPWPAVAQQAVALWRSGGTVLSNSGPFFFSFAYAAGTPWTTTNWNPEANLMDPSNPRVLNPTVWRERGAPLTEHVLLVKGVDPFVPEATAWAEEQLERRCSLQSLDLAVKDSGYALKQRLFPHGGQVLWRIEIRQYRCAATADN